MKGLKFSDINNGSALLTKLSSLLEVISDAEKLRVYDYLHGYLLAKDIISIKDERKDVKFHDLP